MNGVSIKSTSRRSNSNAQSKKTSVNDCNVEPSERPESRFFVNSCSLNSVAIKEPIGNKCCHQMRLHSIINDDSTKPLYHLVTMRAHKTNKYAKPDATNRKYYKRHTRWSIHTRIGFVTRITKSKLIRRNEARRVYMHNVCSMYYIQSRKRRSRRPRS